MQPKTWKVLTTWAAALGALLSIPVAGLLVLCGCVEAKKPTTPQVATMGSATQRESCCPHGTDCPHHDGRCACAVVGEVGVCQCGLKQQPKKTAWIDSWDTDEKGKLRVLMTLSDKPIKRKFYWMQIGNRVILPDWYTDGKEAQRLKTTELRDAWEKGAEGVYKMDYSQRFVREELFKGKVVEVGDDPPPAKKPEPAPPVGRPNATPLEGSMGVDEHHGSRRPTWLPFPWITFDAPEQFAARDNREGLKQ